MIGYVWLLVPIDPGEIYEAREAEAFASKVKALSSGLREIEICGSSDEKTEEEIAGIKADFLRDEECEYCYLANIPYYPL
jgi:hypothetical protein